MLPNLMQKVMNPYGGFIYLLTRGLLFCLGLVQATSSLAQQNSDGEFANSTANRASNGSGHVRTAAEISQAAKSALRQEAKTRRSLASVQRRKTGDDFDGRTRGEHAIQSAEGSEPESTIRESWETAVRDLVVIHDELRLHPQNLPGSRVARLKNTIRVRLLGIHRQLAAVNARTDNSPSAEPQALPPESGERADALAQVAGPGIGVGLPGAGPAAALPGVAAGLADSGFDYGETLVQLIERTIRADVWQTVGGPASIQYYRPGLSLVISAPGDVHDDVADLLWQLRQAN